MQPEFRVDQSSVQGTAAGLRRWGDRVLSDVEAAAGRMAVQMESHAKQTRPWTDRTGQARARLHGFLRRDGADIVIGLAHGVDYGKYLEQCHAGRYAVLMPTVEHFARRFRDAVKLTMGSRG